MNDLGCRIVWPNTRDGRSCHPREKVQEGTSDHCVVEITQLEQLSSGKTDSKKEKNLDRTYPADF